MNLENSSLDKLRSKIDKIDQAILQLIEERSNLAKKIIDAKNGVNIFKPKREQALIKKLISKSKTSKSEYIETIWRLLISENLSLQGGLKIVLGPSADVYKTSLWHFGNGAKFESEETDIKALKKLITGKFDAAVVRASDELEEIITIDNIEIQKLVETPITNQKNLDRVAIYKLLN